MFCEVMKDDAVCKELIERIIDKPLARIVYKTPQSTITAGIDIRSIRLDVRVETVDRTIIDIEMQVEHYLQLPLRFRGYQSILDASYWKRGDEFNNLKETYIIFLCLNDPFAGRNPLNTFEPTCKENVLVDPNFKMHWIVLNAQAAKEAPTRISHLLEYMKTNRSSDDALVQKIDKIVVQTNNDTEKVIALTNVQNKIDECNLALKSKEDELKAEKAAHKRDNEFFQKKIESLERQLKAVKQ